MVHRSCFFSRPLGYFWWVFVLCSFTSRLPVQELFRFEQSVLSASPLSVCSSVLLSLRVVAQPPRFYLLPQLLLPLLLLLMLLLFPLSLCGSEAVTRLSALLFWCLLSACLSLCFILSPIICLSLFALFHHLSSLHTPLFCCLQPSNIFLE